jgi:hypothetical protein
MPCLSRTAKSGLPTVARGNHPSASEGWSGRRGSNPRPTAWKAVTLPLSYSRLRARALRRASPPCLPQQPKTTQLTSAVRLRRSAASAGHPSHLSTARPAEAHSPIHVSEGWWGGEDLNLRSPKAAGLQPAAIDRSATSPKLFCRASGVHALGVVHRSKLCGSSVFCFPEDPRLSSLRPLK